MVTLNIYRPTYLERIINFENLSHQTKEHINCTVIILSILASNVLTLSSVRALLTRKQQKYPRAS